MSTSEQAIPAELLKEADDELMQAQALLLTCSKAVTGADDAPPVGRG